VDYPGVAELGQFPDNLWTKSGQQVGGKCKGD
jgi:hypothetical protein